MHIHPGRLILLTAMLWGLAACFPANIDGLLAAASAQPQPVDRLASKTTPFTAQERVQVEQYVGYWVDQLASGEANSIREAVRALNEPLGAINLTLIFRDEYSRAVVARLEELFATSPGNEVAINALKVAGLLGTERALNLMVERSDPRRESSDAVRLWAAKGFALLVNDEGLRGRQMTRQTRDLARHARNEENWLVLRRQFEALAAAGGSLDQQIEVLHAVADRLMKEDSPSRLIEALNRALVLLRNQWLNLRDTREQQRFGAAAGPAVVRVLELADSHWEAAIEDKRARGWYGAAIQSAETLLIAIDLQVRQGRATMPADALDTAWSSRDAGAFRRQVGAWRDVTSRDPYGRPRGQ